MTYKQTIDFLFSSLPMFQRVGDIAIKKDLTNIRLLCDMLEHPQDAFPSIHVAGTNGKGSTAHMLAAIFQASGKKVGLYTSPHYVDFRERIKINGTMIGEKDVVGFVSKFHDLWRPIGPSFFEITVAMAFQYFRQQGIDIAIIETGLGGRLDSTNIINPKMSVITNIGMDHTQMLGNTLAEIAFEKAGIIKPGAPVIIGEWQKETAPVFKGKATLENTPLHFASHHLRLEYQYGSLTKQRLKVSTRDGIWIESITSDMNGPYQTLNLRTVLETIYRWNQYFEDEKISVPNIKKGLSKVKVLTGLIGRWMVIKRSPLVIADAAHNQHGMAAMLPELLKQPARLRHFVLGFVADKDITAILAMFPDNGVFYWCAPDIPRGRKAADVKHEGSRLGLYGEAYSSVTEAYRQAMLAAGKSDLVFVGGSSYVVGDFLAGLRRQEK